MRSTSQSPQIPVAAAPPRSQDPREPPAPSSCVQKCSHSSRPKTSGGCDPGLGVGHASPGDQAKDSATHLPEHGHAHPVDVLLLQHHPAEPRGGGLVTVWCRWCRRAVCAHATGRSLEDVQVPELAGALSAEPPGSGAPGSRGPCPPVSLSLRPCDQPLQRWEELHGHRGKRGSSSVRRAGGQGAGLPAPEASSVPSSWQAVPALCFSNYSLSVSSILLVCLPLLPVHGPCLCPA